MGHEAGIEAYVRGRRAAEVEADPSSLRSFVEDILRLTQWRIIHEGHRTGWAKRNPGMWFCFECGCPAPTDFDPVTAPSSRPWWSGVAGPSFAVPEEDGAGCTTRQAGTTVPIDQHEGEVLTVEQAGQVLGIAKDSAYRLVREGAIPALRLGRRWVVPKARLMAFLEGRLP